MRPVWGENRGWNRGEEKRGEERKGKGGGTRKLKARWKGIEGEGREGGGEGEGGRVGEEREEMEGEVEREGEREVKRRYGRRDVREERVQREDVCEWVGGGEERISTDIHVQSKH